MTASVINDAFHVPNERELLTEMHRVLRNDGIVAMSEPGRGHAAAGHSVHEAREFGVSRTDWSWRTSRRWLASAVRTGKDRRHRRMC